MTTLGAYGLLYLAAGVTLAVWVLVRTLDPGRQQWLRSRGYVDFGTRDLVWIRWVMATASVVLWPVILAGLVDESRRGDRKP